MADMGSRPRFDELVREGERVPVEGWDFSWFAGRATEQRPPWGYQRLISSRIAAAAAVLDIDTGGGEVLAGIAQAPPLLVATESWPANIGVARRNLNHLGATVVEVEPHAALPFPNGTFDLIVSRHPIATRWDEVARLLTPAGTFLAQEVGEGSVRELTEFLMGPQTRNDARSTARAVAAAEGAGLEVVALQQASLRMEFHDVAAVIVFLRKVIWIVPGFTVERYRERLEDLHRRIEARGAFVAHSTRFLIEARKPG
jgi:SAM-dependent methyltransferase